MMDYERRLTQTCNLSNEYFMRQAKFRWLRPSEIYEILCNHNRFNLSVDSPHKPPSGSLLLFDRKVFRYFRKDGHCWRKKKDGKTVREAHEKLKIGNVDALHCYYAHGEDNNDFQRRIYWLIDEKLDNIVLVHYRDLSEASRILADTDQTTISQSSALCSSDVRSNFAIQEADPSSPSTARCLQTSDFEYINFEDECGPAVDSLSFAPFPRNDSAENSSAECSGLIDSTNLNQPVYFCSPDQMTLQNVEPTEGYRNLRAAAQIPGLFDGANFSHYAVSSSMWSGMLSSKPEIGGMHCMVSTRQSSYPDGFSKISANSLSNNNVEVGLTLSGEYNVSSNMNFQSIMGDSKAEVQETVGDAVCISNPYAGKNMMHDSSHAYHMPNDLYMYRETQLSNESLSQSNILSANQPLEYNTEVFMIPNNTMENEKHPLGHGELSKLDSFGRWMDKEIDKDCVDSLMTSDSYWTDIETEAGDGDVTSLSHHSSLGVDSVGPSLQEQLFSIQDFSPDWALSGVETKVLIAGRFLGKFNPADFKWSCMFGETEVPAELLPTNVIRCKAPIHAPGHVPFYITTGNRLACSEVREFEYLEDLPGETTSSASNSNQEDDVNFQLRFAEMVSLGANRKIQACAVENCQKCNLKKDLFPMLCSDIEWDKLEKDIKSPKDALVQQMFKRKLYEWLVYKAHEEGRGPYVLNEEGQGVIHLSAALGYQWAMKPIVTAGVNPSFRDVKGRTGLHWAAYYGREETVLELIKLGAAPGAIDDPTSKNPEGQTAADLAWIKGHNGIAGYLAELDLSSHLSELRLGESVLETLSADVASEDASETLQRQVTGSLNGDERGQLAVALALSRLLVAVRNSEFAAKCNQTALKYESRHKSPSTRSNYVPFEISDEALLVSSLNNQDPRSTRSTGFNDYLHSVAATKNQQKLNRYRGNKDFLKVHSRFVKKPHVLEDQVGKPYENLVQAVDSLEKSTLCWAHKSAGLQGFRSAEGIGCGEQETGEYQFLAPGQQQKAVAVMKALERVKSMALQPDAREQYMRLVTSSHQPQLGKQSTHLAQDQSSVERLEFDSN